MSGHSKKKPVLPGKNPKKTRRAEGVVLEDRRYIGFARQPVQERDVKPIITGLPTHHYVW